MVKPVLDPGFIPAVIVNRQYRAECQHCPGAEPLVIGLERPDGTVFVHRSQVLPLNGGTVDRTRHYVERLVKTLLWMQGGATIYVGGPLGIAEHVERTYAEDGPRAFDCDSMGKKLFRQPMRVVACAAEAVPDASEAALALGRNLDGCRIGFDLGGSDRKSAAVIDGQVVFSEEVAWDPYFQSDPSYHYEGIRDSLRRAAEHLPRVDAIGGSAAGVYVDCEPRAASLFRGISEEDFASEVRPMFRRLREEWGNVPFEVVNDGEVTALAGSMSLNDNAVLGLSMGTSLAAGYCNAKGHITSWLNELAFTPVDYRADAPADEWSGDIGCGVQYFSQQAVSRLLPAAGIEVPDDLPLPDRLKHVQSLMERGDDRARRIYETIGTYLGYALGGHAEFYEIRHLLLLGRVTTGEGGRIIIDKTREVLGAEFPELSGMNIATPDEKLKRHGQAIAAASLPKT